VEGAIPRPASRHEIVHHQQRVLGREGETLQDVGRRSEIGGQLAGVHFRSEVLLAQGCQGGFEGAGLSREKETEIYPPKRRPVHSGKQRKADAVGR